MYVFESQDIYLFKDKITIKHVEFIPRNTSVLRLKIYSYSLLGIYLLSKIYSESTIQHIGNIGIYIYVGFMINLWKDKKLNVSVTTISFILPLSKALNILISSFLL